MSEINIDDELRLLSGSSFFVGEIKNGIDNRIEIKPFILKEIVDIGYIKYQQLMNIFVVEVGDILKEIPEELKNVTVFDLFTKSGIKELLEPFLDSMCVFLRTEKFSFDKETNFLVDGKIIDNDKWLKICKIVKMQNCVEKRVEEEYNPANEEARKIIEKIKALKKEHPRKESITFTSMISGISWKSNNVNIIDVWNLTIYQLYDALNRLNLIDNYQFTLSGIYAGTLDGKKIDLKELNWMKTFKN